MNLTADEFNEKHPIGTPVKYEPVLPPVDGVIPLITITRTPAWELSNGDVLVSVAGRPGGMALSHIELMPVHQGQYPPPLTPSNIMERIDALAAAQKEDESIRCPYCGEKQVLDFCDGDGDLVTIWGEDLHTRECEFCEAEFRVRESVTRTFDTAKLGEDF